MEMMPKEGCSLYPKQEDTPLVHGGAGVLAFRFAFDSPEGDEKEGEGCEDLGWGSGSVF